ncbi:hypothetical protein [Actinoplanes sp. NPDC051411]|uniref:ArdC-like ssDNA-binding domain-containing protein n=1 Tax=Actinoplanes sp. NPDC051411 TaxID=3155522 RepID=UPI003429C7D6
MPRTNTRRRSDPEAAAEARRRDEQIHDDSTRYLENTDEVRRLIHQAASGAMSYRILGYSLRNQCLLHNQAAERGIALTDVDTFKGWLSRGRVPKTGETGMRIVRPIGKPKRPGETHQGDQGDPANEDIPTDTGDDAETDSAKPSRPKFRTDSRFDVSQTAPLPLDRQPACGACNADAGEPCNVGCDCPACQDPMPTGDAAEYLRDNLSAQIERKGYALVHFPALTTAVRVDHDGNAVHVVQSPDSIAPEAIADLAAALAEITARADHAAKARRAARKKGGRATA